MKKLKFYILILLLSVAFNACKDYVTNVDPLIDQIDDKNLNTPAQLPFLIKGVQNQFANATSVLNVLADGLSDQFKFDQNVPNATFPTFKDIDNGTITFDNNSVRGVYTALGRYRFLADDLVRRTNSMTVSDATLKNQALFTGEFYGGYARYQYATYIGLNPTQGGSPVDGGPFIPSAQLYAQAIAKFKTALTLTTDAKMIRIINSIIARAYIYNGDYANAATYAKLGMQSGDAPFTALHNVQQSNYYWQQAGVGRTQYVVTDRIYNYTLSDPNEKNRIPLDSLIGTDKKTKYYRQNKYPSDASSDIIITWQENNLMLAELALRGQATGVPLTLVNQVRASHGIAPLVTVTLDDIYVERDKELFVTGNRLPDERRFGKWHLPAGTWQYLPITDDERNSNKNL